MLTDGNVMCLSRSLSLLLGDEQLRVKKVLMDPCVGKTGDEGCGS